MTTSKVKCYAVHEAKGRLTEWSFEPKALGDNDIELKVLTCGICHTDISIMNSEWFPTPYPCVPGHEIIGEIIKIGEKVNPSKFHIGMRVGVGPQRLACFSCNSCERLDENTCERLILTYGGADYDGVPCYGGYSQFMRVHERFTYPIPEKMPSEYAPLLCAGITTYFPFVHDNVRPSHKVAIIGIGGLGHLALQYSRALGLDTTAISTSENKREEALNLGAHHFMNSSKPEFQKEGFRKFDYILNTASSEEVQFQISKYTNLLRPDGKLVLAGILGTSIVMPVLPLIMNRIAISGSNIGGSKDMREMLDFSTRNNIKPKVEIMKMSQVNEAVDKVRKNQVRYRMVLENDF